MMKVKPNLIKIQFTVLVLGFILMLVKYLAYVLTQSHAILSDALESIINVAAGGFALYSLWLSQKPKDNNHPYGHGKIEFISTGFEGGMIMIAGCFILYQAGSAFFNPPIVKELDLGIFLVAISGGVNFLMGSYLVKFGKAQRADAMVADGKHLLSDTYTSIGLVLGLILVNFTGEVWLDSLIALIMGMIILYTGYKLIRRALAGLMDETDMEVLEELLPVLNQNRKKEWIDIHNLRVLKYGNNFHVDAHVTLPWYWSLVKAHEEVSAIDSLTTQKFHENIELFIHADPCIPNSCQICEVHPCSQRKFDFVERVEWNINNVLKNEKHAYKPAQKLVLVQPL
ncbi:MAG: cation diffusion facilitator family transporter [bacterium]|nr:cation diffusion facilitator family transporter [bacterium]